jgi:hypothetical protein
MRNIKYYKYSIINEENAKKAGFEINITIMQLHTSTQKLIHCADTKTQNPHNFHCDTQTQNWNVIIWFSFSYSSTLNLFLKNSEKFYQISCTVKAGVFFSGKNFIYFFITLRFKCENKRQKVLLLAVKK